MRAETGGEAWPSIRTLCGDLSIASDSAIRRGLSAMVAAGHLEAEPVNGGTTRYRIAAKYLAEPRLKDERGYEDTPPIFEAGTPPIEAGTPPIEAGTPPIFEAGTPPIFEAGTPPIFEAGTPPIFEATSTGHRNPDNETRTVKSGHSERGATPREIDLFAGEEKGRARKPRNASSPPAEDESFGSFWNAYPRRVGKAAAKKAFDRAVKDGARPEEITLGAMRFAAERERAEPDPATRERFTPHPATWLNSGRWEDAPAAALPSMPGDFKSASAPPQRPSKRPSALELAMAMNAADEERRR
jgi:hypothetical protein